MLREDKKAKRGSCQNMTYHVLTRAALFAFSFYLPHSRNNSLSRSRLNPTFNSASLPLHASVSRTVSATGRNVKPSLIALLQSMAPKPASSCGA